MTTFPEHKRLRVITSALVTVFFEIDISARPSSEFSKDKFINSARIVSSLLAIAYARSCNAVPDIMKLSKFKKSKKKRASEGISNVTQFSKYDHNGLIVESIETKASMISTIHPRLMEGSLAIVIFV